MAFSEGKSTAVSPRRPSSSKRKTPPQGDTNLVASSADGAGNRTSCHQCRQKTLDYKASCCNVVDKRPCRINVCQKCLNNRYGESVEAAAASSNWKCPRCRGICNCSICRNKNGEKPTGKLAPRIKRGGYISVYHYLQAGESIGVTSHDSIAVCEGKSSSFGPRVVYAGRNAEPVPKKLEKCLEEELAKIKALPNYMNVLPLSIQLVNQAIEACKQHMLAENSLPGPSDGKLSSILDRSITEQFILQKRNVEIVEDDDEASDKEKFFKEA